MAGARATVGTGFPVTQSTYVNDKVVTSGKFRTQAGEFTLSGDGLCVGYDSGDAVRSLYMAPAKFTGRHDSSRGRDR